MRNTTLSMIGIVLLTATGYGQSDEVLTARSAKNTVFCEIDPAAKQLRFLGNRTDEDDVLWEYATKEDEPLLLIKDNTYNLCMRLHNPLKYRIVVEGNTYEDDEYDKTLRGLADNFQGLLTVLTHDGTALGTIPGGDELSNNPAFNAGPATTVEGLKINLTGVEGVVTENTRSKIEGLRDFDLRRAIVIINQIVEADFFRDERDVVPRIEATENVFTKAAKAIEQNADGDMIEVASAIVAELVEVDLPTQGATKSIGRLQTVIKDLRQRNVDLDQMIAGLAALDTAVKSEIPRVQEAHLEARVNEILEEERKREAHTMGIKSGRKTQGAADKRKAAEIKAKRERDEDSDWFSLGPEEQRKELKVLGILEVAVEQFASRMTRFSNERKLLLKNLDELMRLVTKAQDQATGTEHGTELIHSRTIPKGKAETVTVSVKQRSISIEKNYGVKVQEEDLLTHKLKFMRVHTFYPQAFPAVVFINDVFPEFTAKEDSVGLLRVQSKTNSQGYFNLAGMINFNVKLGRKTEVPFIQIGASAKKSQPQVFLGTGIRFTEWFALSFGAALTWQASLNKLNIGGKVENQDAIDDDLQYRMSDPKFYFGIQLRPSTITKKP